VVVVLGPDDLWEGPGEARVVRGPLLELARVLAGCDLAIGNDSGLTHVAAAAGTPAVVLFGPTTPALGFLPVGTHRVVERHDLNCRPCDVHGGRRCPRRDQACLAGIPPARVMAEVDDLAAELAGQEMVHVR
jgi:ADP-heptose:LPS heptosyltransferase